MQFKVLFALAFATLAAAVPSADSGPAKTNQGTTASQVKLEPPFTAGKTIKASQCSSGHLRCCKFHFPEIDIVRRCKRTSIMIGKSSESPSKAATLLKSLGYNDPSKVTGTIGLDCSSISADGVKSWYVSTGNINP